MTYFSDFQNCTYHDGPHDAANWRCPLYAIGWLESGRDFVSGVASKDLIDCLLKLRKQFGEAFQGASFRGLHYCSLCADTGNHSIHLPGSHINFFVPGKNCVFIAPGGIDHYLIEHSYKPPDEFIDAIETCPEPSSAAFRHAIRESNQGYDGPLFTDYVL